MNILHLNSYDFGGAAKAAFRLFHGLRKSGYPSKMLVQKKQVSDPDVISLQEIQTHLPSKKMKDRLQPFVGSTDPDYYFFGRNVSPDVDVSKILGQIGFKPDIIVAYWISNFLAVEDLYLLQEASGAPVVWYLMDMGPLTGGCHYAWDCLGYQHNCGKCPALFSKNENDFSRKNLERKYHFLEKMNIACVPGSEWLFQQSKESTLFRDRNITKIFSAVDQNIFRPLPKIENRRSLRLPTDKKILFFGAESFSERRKGMNFLLESLKYLAQNQWISRKDTLLLSLGKTPPNEIQKAGLFPILHGGYISGRDDLLAKIYAAADVFICPSIEDSGPLMINEAIMCGTPVVSFEMGVAPDLVQNGTTGYRAPLKNSEELAKGTSSLLNASPKVLEQMRDNCRKLGLKLLTPGTQVQNFISLFEQLAGFSTEFVPTPLDISITDEMRIAMGIVRNHTMLSIPRQESLFQQALQCEKEGIAGAFVECGVWKGGAVGLMAHANLRFADTRRDIHLFDSFQEICEPDTAVDGERAIREVKSFAPQAGISGKLEPIRGIYDSVGGAGSLEINRELLEEKIGYDREFLHYHVGWFQETLPEVAPEISKIAILRLDGDWYASTKVCLEHLYDKVVPGGFIIIDDYGTYEGCKKAVDEFLIKRRIQSKIHWIDTTGIFWIKGHPENENLQAFSGSDQKLLNLGCGNRTHPAWVNVDFIARRPGVIAHDLSQAIPFPADEFDAVYHSHLLEHFTREVARNFIGECYRVLKPGGILRVVIPDLENIVHEYLKWLELAEKGTEGAADNYDWILLELLDQMTRNFSGGEMGRHLARPDIPNRDYIVERIGEEYFPRHSIDAKNSSQVNDLMRSFYEIGKFQTGGEVHQWMYDRYSLARLLKEAGFSEIRRQSAEKSDIPGFIDYGLDLFCGKPRGSSSLFMEAMKYKI